MSNIRKILKYFIVFLVPIICMVIHMYIRKCYPFGDNTILLGDANAQYYWFEKMLLEKIKNGESILFSWQAGMGFEFYQNFFYYLGSPFNVIAMIIGNWDMELGVVITMLVQIGMCSVTMLYYLGHTSRNTMKTDKVNVPICMTLALVYSMCDYFLAYQYNYIWLISLMLAPLVMLGVERLIDTGKTGLYIVVLVAVFVTNFYFAWFICILSFIWYFDYCRGPFKQVVKLTIKYLITSFEAAMISAFVLVPCYLAVSDRAMMSYQDSDLSWSRFGNIADFVYSFLWGSNIDQAGHDYFNNNNYVGVSTLLFAFMFVLNKNISISARLKRLIEIGMLSLALNCGLGSYIFHGFTFPNSYSNRFAFILSIILIVTSFEELVNLSRNNIMSYVIAIAFMASIIFIALVCVEEPGNISTYLVSIGVCVFCIICFILYSRKSIRRTTIRWIFISVCLLECIANYYMVMVTSYDISEENKRNTKAWISEYDNIVLDKGERKSSWMNSQCGMGNSDASIFTSVINSNMVDLFANLGLDYQNNNVTYKGTTPVTAMMFNVRSVLTDHGMYYGGYKCVKEASKYNKYTSSTLKYGLYESQYMVGLGYLVNDKLEKWCLDNGNPFEVQNQFVINSFGVDNVFEEAKIYNLSVTPFGCRILKNNGLEIKYENIWPKDGIFLAANIYKFKINENEHIYVYAKDNNGVITSVKIDGKDIVSDNNYLTPGELIDIGQVKKGQEIIIRVSNSSLSGYDGTTRVYVYKYNDDVMKRALQCANKSVYNIQTCEDNKVKGTINADKNGVLYTSIPYYKGIKVKVDGEKSIVKIGKGLCGVKLTKGFHVVEFIYVPYGIKAGIIMSSIMIIIVILGTRIIRRR